MPNKINFTKRAIEAIRPPESGERNFYGDTKTTGLGLRVTSAGTKTFVVYRKIRGRPERITLGTFPSVTVEKARKLAAHVNSAIAENTNPADLRRAKRGEMTLGELFDAYLNDHLRFLDKRTESPQSRFKVYLAGWAHRKLSNITDTDVDRLHKSIKRHKSPVTANRVLALLRAMYNWAGRERLFKGLNPTTGIHKFPERARERFVHPDELPRFFQALAEDPSPYLRDFVLTCLLTGARRSNVQCMRWAEINWDRATWTIPQTKTGDPHTVPLAPEALRILRNRKTRTTSEWVFPSHGSTGHIVEPKRAWTALLGRAEIEDLHIHDLRRTLGSWQAATGANLSVIGKTLAHKNVATTAIYARLDLDPVRAAVNKATAAMLKAAGVLSDADVVRMKREA